MKCVMSRCAFREGLECFHKKVPFFQIPAKTERCEHYLHQNELYNSDKSIVVSGMFVSADKKEKAND